MPGEPGAETVLLHEWHVGLYVPREIQDLVAEGVRRHVEGALRSWAGGFFLGTEGHLTVEA